MRYSLQKKYYTISLGDILIRIIRDNTRRVSNLFVITALVMTGTFINYDLNELTIHRVFALFLSTIFLGNGKQEERRTMINTGVYNNILCLQLFFMKLR